ncbi:hypothetical protein L7F22_045796 [Adiantum nelumboides]|nr:hypothetical protein [Adiantum nelumboides]
MVKVEELLGRLQSVLEERKGAHHVQDMKEVYGTWRGLARGVAEGEGHQGAAGKCRCLQLEDVNASNAVARRLLRCGLGTPSVCTFIRMPYARSCCN